MTPSLFGHGEQQLLIFLNHLNAQKSTIKFTMEQEINGQLPFLDVLVKRNSRHLHTSIYRKPTHMDCYIHFKLNHHPATKLGTILTLKRRADEICKGQDFKEELHHLLGAFTANGYPHGLVQNTLSKRRKIRQPDLKPEDQHRILCIPYIRGFSENLPRTCRSLKVKIVHEATTTLCSILSKAKIP